jgi:MFS family permease
MLLSSLGVSVANVALPTLAQAFTASFQQVQWVVTAYLLATTVVIVGVGRLGDVVGRHRLLLAGTAVFTGASVLCAAAPTLGVLVAARALQGVGAAVLMALTLALVPETVARERTGRAMGLRGTASAVGTALGPSFGGALLAGPGWRAVFLALAPLGVAGRRRGPSRGPFRGPFRGPGRSDGLGPACHRGAAVGTAVNQVRSSVSHRSRRRSAAARSSVSSSPSSG